MCNGTLQIRRKLFTLAFGGTIIVIIMRLAKALLVLKISNFRCRAGKAVS
jgi:hypothetical protein